jgi:glycosyltransferase involved in cell wall biosynthesis
MSTSKILHLVHTPGPGGTEQVVLNLLQWMPLGSFTQTLGAPLGALGAAAQAKGIAFYHIPFQTARRSHSLPGFFSSAAGLRQTMRALRNAIDVVEPAIVHSHGAKATILSGLVGGRRRPWKLVWHLHDYLPLGQMRSVLVKLALRQADTVVAVSADVGAVVCRDHAVHVIPNAVPPLPSETAGCGKALRAQRGIPDHGPLVGYAGRLDHEKGIAVLLDSLSRSQIPDVQLLVAGDSPFQPRAMRAYWEEEARKRNLHRRVHFLGRLPDLTAFFQAIDVFVLPAPREPFGLVILEAFARGVPVVACDAGGPHEIMADLEWSRLVPPNDPSAFAAAYDLLLRSVELQRLASREGPCIVDQRYSPAVQVRAVSALYDEVLSP